MLWVLAWTFSRKASWTHLNKTTPIFSYKPHHSNFMKIYDHQHLWFLENHLRIFPFKNLFVKVFILSLFRLHQGGTPQRPSKPAKNCRNLTSNLEKTIQTQCMNWRGSCKQSNRMQIHCNIWWLALHLPWYTILETPTQNYPIKSIQKKQNNSPLHHHDY